MIVPDNLFLQVKAIYDKGSIPWFFAFHIQKVAAYAEEISTREKTSPRLPVAAALLHDLARAWGTWEEPMLMDETLKKSREILSRNNFSIKEISEILSAIQTHGCRKNSPKTITGKILSTSDALAHLITRFYFELPVYDKSFNKNFREWALEKISRDYNRKIRFQKDKSRAAKYYKSLKFLLEAK